MILMLICIINIKIIVIVHYYSVTRFIIQVHHMDWEYLQIQLNDLMRSLSITTHLNSSIDWVYLIYSKDKEDLKCEKK